MSVSMINSKSPENQEFSSSIPLPKVDGIVEEHDMLNFNVSNTNVSIVNGLRRTIISDIETAVIDTDDNSINIEHNTTMFNNEILKQRLGCIPYMLVI